MKKIVILQRGFVWVGEVEQDPKNNLFFIMKNGATIRNWGTSTGLGSLADTGPTPNTVLDKHECNASFTLLSLIGWYDCSDKWD